MWYNKIIGGGVKLIKIVIGGFLMVDGKKVIK